MLTLPSFFVCLNFSGKGVRNFDAGHSYRSSAPCPLPRRTPVLIDFVVAWSFFFFHCLPFNNVQHDRSVISAYRVPWRWKLINVSNYCCAWYEFSGWLAWCSGIFFRTRYTAVMEWYSQWYTALGAQDDIIRDLRAVRSILKAIYCRFMAYDGAIDCRFLARDRAVLTVVRILRKSVPNSDSSFCFPSQKGRHGIIIIS